MKRGISILCLLGLLGTGGAGPIVAQQPASSQTAPPSQAASSPHQRPSRIFVPAYTVIVPVTVKDSHGQLVGDLRRGDFEIFADEVEQHIGNFSADPVPLSAVVLIDNDLPDRAAGQVQKSLSAIAAGFGPPDEAALVTYDQYPATVSDFSSNNDKLFTQLKRVELGSHSDMVIADPTTAGPVVNGKSLPTATGIPLHGSKRYRETDALNDALYDAATMFKDRGRERRKIIFLISDGANSSQNTHTFDETLHKLQSSDVSVYSISVSRSLPIGRSLLQRGAADIDKYAAETGGDTFYAAKQRSLERLYSDVTEQARNQYTLTFSPQDINPNKDYHSIEVRVLRPGLSIEARKGYYQSTIASIR